MAESSRIGIIVLAAGNSTRMGRPKQLLPYRGTTLLRHAVGTAIQTGFAPVVVVLGSESDRCRAEIAGLPVQLVINLDWPQGMGTSVRTGIRELVQLAPGVRAALIMLHDQPMISAARLREFATTWLPASRAVAVASIYGGALGVPALFARELFDQLGTLADQGARQILEAHRERVIPFPMAEMLHDIDTPADYERWA